MTTELQRVLAALDDLVLNEQGDMTARTAEGAARVIRELAADFERYGTHWPDCMSRFGWEQHTACTCGLDAAREKWRLE